MADNAKKKQVILKVVIPFYNNYRLACWSLRKLIKSGVPKKHIIFIDDASTEKVYNIKLAQSAGAYLRNAKNAGWIRSTNSAITRKIKYFIPLGNGDLLLPGAYNKILRKVKANPDCGIFAWPILEIDQSSGKKMTTLNNFNNDPYERKICPQEFSSKFYGKSVIGQACYRTSIWEKYGKFRPDLKWHADHFLFHLIGNSEQIYLFRKPLGTFLRSKGSYGSKSEGPEQNDLCRSAIKWLGQKSNQKNRKLLIRSGALCVFEHVLSKVMQNHHSRNMYIDIKMRRWLFLKKVRGLVRHPIPKNVKEAFRKVFRTMSTSKPHSPLNRN
jgi:glycosyltransferase involved in cell wall biosynthesis